MEGREESVCDGEREVVLVEFDECSFKVLAVSKSLGKTVSLILKSPHKLNHEKRENLKEMRTS